MYVIKGERSSVTQGLSVFLHSWIFLRHVRVKRKPRRRRMTSAAVVVTVVVASGD